MNYGLYLEMIKDELFPNREKEFIRTFLTGTTLLLLGIVVCLNLAAMSVRGRLRGQFRGAAI